MDRSSRYFAYLLLTISLGILGAYTNLFLPSISWGLTYGTVGLILGFVMEIYMKTVTKEDITAKIIYDEDELKSTYKKMREDSTCRDMQAIWCTRYADVPKYFKEEEADFLRNPRLHIKRLINPKRTQEGDYELHSRSSKKLLGRGKYEVKETDISEFECVVCEYEKPSGREQKALFIINDLDGNSPSLGIFLDPTKYEEASTKYKKTLLAVRTIKSWFERQWERTIAG